LCPRLGFNRNTTATSNRPEEEQGGRFAVEVVKIHPKK
jgi:hypothetical protein